MLRRKPQPAEAVTAPTFAEWLLHQFAKGEPTAALPFAGLEAVCARAASLLIGAVYGRPEAFDAPVSLGGVEEARLIARRTADGFRASLADRNHTVIAWPWDHVATSVAWSATRSGETLERELGEQLIAIAAPYALHNREQLTAVLDLWTQVAANTRPGAAAPQLDAMGAEMYAAWERVG